jgi:ribosomal protein S18 acetylase RimI-like enzyme
MIEISIVDIINPPKRVLRSLLRDYMTWGNEQVNQRYGYAFDIAALIREDLRTLDQYAPELGGRLLLAKINGKPVGLVGLHKLNEQTGEITRLYVRPQGRGLGIARRMMNKLRAAAVEMGYTSLRLETMAFMQEASALYRSMGFREIDPYPETTMPPELWSSVLFMELNLTPASSPNPLSGSQAVSYTQKLSDSPSDWIADKDLPHLINRFYHL